MVSRALREQLPLSFLFSELARKPVEIFRALGGVSQLGRRLRELTRQVARFRYGCLAVDRLATAAMREATRKKRKLVERDVIGRVIDLESKEAAA
jgi:hypothetical protein